MNFFSSYYGISFSEFEDANYDLLNIEEIENNIIKERIKDEHIYDTKCLLNNVRRKGAIENEDEVNLINFMNVEIAGKINMILNKKNNSKLMNICIEKLGPNLYNYVEYTLQFSSQMKYNSRTTPISYPTMSIEIINTSAVRRDKAKSILNILGYHITFGFEYKLFYKLIASDLQVDQNGHLIFDDQYVWNLNAPENLNKYTANYYATILYILCAHTDDYMKSSNTMRLMINLTNLSIDNEMITLQKFEYDTYCKIWQLIINWIDELSMAP